MSLPKESIELIHRAVQDLRRLADERHPSVPLETKTEICRNLARNLLETAVKRVSEEQSLSSEENRSTRSELEDVLSEIFEKEFGVGSWDLVE